jgi:hypothetical protein
MERRRQMIEPRTSALGSQQSAPHLPDYDDEPTTDQAVGGPQGIRMANYNRRKRR